MALPANRSIAGSTIFSTLESEYGYRTVMPEEIEAYLDHHQELFVPLVQAAAAIGDFFPNRTGVELSLFRDYESGDEISEGVLFVTVELPNLTVDNHLDLLNTFLERWYILASRDSRPARKLIFDLR